MYDVVDWTLERMFAISGAHATRIPIKLMGRNKRASGNANIKTKKKLIKPRNRPVQFRKLEQTNEIAMFPQQQQQ